MRHAPQFSRSVSRSTHTPSFVALARHRVRPPAHGALHRPNSHTCPPAHPRPQAPQLAALVFVSTSHPFSVAPSQFANPGRQMMPHTPTAQSTPAFARTGQALPQRPQWAAADRVSTQAPPHDVSPASQTQAPATQLAPAAHARPHAPQWARSVVTSTQAVLQLVRPAGQTQLPLTQAAPGGQRRLQRPQWLTSRRGSTQAPPQRA